MALNDSFEALKGLLSEAAQTVAGATKNAAAVTKANINIFSEQEKLKKAYMELGKLYYRDYITGEEPDDAEYLPLCDNISEITKTIDELRGTKEEIRAAKAAKEEAPAEAPIEEAPVEEAPAEEAPAEETPAEKVKKELGVLQGLLDKLARKIGNFTESKVEEVKEVIFEVVEDQPAEAPKEEAPAEEAPAEEAPAEEAPAEEAPKDEAAPE